MRTVAIAMKRGAWIGTLRSALNQAERPGNALYEFVIEGTTNDCQQATVEIRFDNDDMERSEVPDDACYVDVRDD